MVEHEFRFSQYFILNIYNSLYRSQMAAWKGKFHEYQKFCSKDRDVFMILNVLVHTNVEFVTKSAQITSPFKSRSNTIIRKKPSPHATSIPFNPYIFWKSIQKRSENTIKEIRNGSGWFSRCTRLESDLHASKLLRKVYFL